MVDELNTAAMVLNVYCSNRSSLYSGIQLKLIYSTWAMPISKPRASALMNGTDLPNIFTLVEHEHESNYQALH